MRRGTGGWGNGRVLALSWCGVWRTCCGGGWLPQGTRSVVPGSETPWGRGELRDQPPTARSRTNSTPPRRLGGLPQYPSLPPPREVIDVDPALHVVALMLQAPREPTRALHPHRLPRHRETL